MRSRRAPARAEVRRKWRLIVVPPEVPSPGSRKLFLFQRDRMDAGAGEALFG